MSEVAARARDVLRKVVVWDLDDTLWRGVLLEGGGNVLRDGAERVVRELDARGILQSIASRNEPDLARARLEHLGLAEYFLCPQIHWGDKGASVRDIASALDVALEAIVFVDDQPFERAAVAHSAPGVLCVDAEDLTALLVMPELSPREITDEARRRRQLYRSELARRDAERAYSGTPEAFLETLDLRLEIARATPVDLARAEELTLRTHQMNTTGIAYSREELAARLESPDHRVWVARLEDRYGSYGTIGLAMLARDHGRRAWVIELFLTSCRVISRGVGAVFLAKLVRDAAADGAIFARFRPTQRNRIMYVTYRFAGFAEVERRDGEILLRHDLVSLPAIPSYVALTVRA